MTVPALNLTSQDRKNQLRSQLTALGVRQAFMLGLVFILCATAMMISLRMILWSYKTSLQKTAAMLESAVAQDYASSSRASVQQLNVAIHRAAALQKDFLQWSAVLSAFSDVLPPHMTVNDISLDATTRTIHASGVAATRADLTDFTAALQQSALFKNAVIPPSDIFLSVNIPFSFTAQISL